MLRRPGGTASSRSAKSAGKYSAASYLPDCTGRPARRGRSSRCCGSAARSPRAARRAANVTSSSRAFSGSLNSAAAKLVVLEQRRQVAEVPAADDQHLRRLLLHELRDLQEAHAQQRIEQDRQHEDHEQRAPVAQLVADLAGEDQFDVADSSCLRSCRGRHRVRRMRFVVLRKSIGRTTPPGRARGACRGAPPASLRPEMRRGA